MNGDETSSKTNTKLDTFLKKKLEPKVFEQLRYNESCIVVGDKYDKVFSYVVLGHEWIYVTENPPKTVKEEVHYRDVTRIELRNDFPDFLGGAERTNTLHAVVYYRSPVRHKSFSKTSTTSLRPTSPRPVHKSMSAPVFPQRAKSASPRLDRRRMGSQAEAGWDDDDEQFLQGAGTADYSSNESLNSFSKSDAEMMRQVRSPSPQLSPWPVSPRPVSPRPTSPRPPLEARDSNGSIDVPSGDGSSASPKTKRREQVNSEPDQRPASLKLPQSSSIHKDSLLHIYMLKSDSPIINHLTNAWTNYLIRGTFLCDIEQPLITQQKKMPHERLASLFDQLTHEIRLPDNSMEDVFSLINELKTATEKNFLLKKFFWKYGDLFYFTVDYLKRYIPGKVIADDLPALRSKRADELELATLLLELLSLELRETDVLAQRAHCLRQAEGRHLADLIVVCTSTPALPTPYYVPSRRASELLQQVQADDHRSSLNLELSELATDLTRLSSCVVYELFLLAKQDVYCSRTFITVPWLVDKIKKAKNLDSFVERVLQQSMKYVSPSERQALSARDAVLLYQQLYVLRCLLDTCPSVLTLLRARFSEEFKYYVQGPVLWSKLPPSYAISKPTIALLEKIMSKVLRKDVKLAVPEVRFD